MSETAISVCPNCHLPVLADFYYCPNCSQALRPKPIAVSTFKQIGIYLLSFFLPPFGLYPAIKYIRQGDPKIKTIGWVAVALTVISIILSIYIFSNFMQQVAKTLDQVGGGQLQNISI